MAPAKGWTEKRLDEIAEIEREIVSPEAIQAGTKYVGLEHIDGAGDFVGVRTVANGDLASAKFRFTRQHVLFGKLRPYLRKIARPDFEGICSTDILPILPKPGTDRGFLFHYLRHPRVIEEATLRCEGANLPRLSPRQLETFPVSVPSMEAEQKRIATILDRADAIRRRRHEAARLTEQLIPSLFYDMFGDPGRNPKGWPTRNIGRLTTLVTSGLTPSGGAQVYVNEGPYFIRSQNVLMNRLDFSDAACLPSEIHESMSRTKVAVGDVLLNITGASIGRIAWVEWLEREANVNQHVCIVRLDQEQAAPEYVSVCLSLPWGQQLIMRTQSGASRQGLNHQQVRQIEIPYPAPKLQHEFAKRIREVRALQRDHETQRRESNAIFDSLVQRAFRGEL